MNNTVWLRRFLTKRLNAMTTEHHDHKRDLDPNKPLALDDMDPGNSDPDDFTAPLDPDDDIYSIVLPQTDETDK